jgi:hypothetical protein
MQEISPIFSFYLDPSLSPLGGKTFPVLSTETTESHHKGGKRKQPRSEKKNP